MWFARKLTEKEQIALDVRTDLIARAKGGDTEARAELMLHHGMWVYTPAEILAFEGV